MAEKDVIERRAVDGHFQYFDAGRVKCGERSGVEGTIEQQVAPTMLYFAGTAIGKG